MGQMNLFEVLYEKYKITKPIRLIELFGGIGSQAKALEVLEEQGKLPMGFEHYRLVEFDKYPVASYNAIHHTNFEPTDITKIHAQDLGIRERERFEYIMTYSFPCQDISGAGKMRGFNKDNQLHGQSTRSGLLWEVERLLNECGTELPQVLLLENVKNLLCEKFMPDFKLWLSYLESKGYTNYYEVLNAKNYGIPQNRERVFCLSILGKDKYYEFPKPIPLKLKLKDMLEDEVDEKYYLSKKMIAYLTGVNQKESKFPRGERFKETLKSTNEKGIASALTTTGNRPTDNFILETDDDKPSFDELYNKLKNSDFVQQSKRIQEKDICDTLLARDYKDPKCVIVGNKALKETLEKNEIEDGTFIDAYNRSVKKDIAGTITTRIDASNNTFVAVKNNNKKGYEETYEGDSISLERLESQTRRGRVGHNVAQTLMTDCNQGVVVKIGNYSPSGHSAASIVSSEGIAPTVMENHGTVTATNVGLRIRKITPKEAWRLMGFTDEDFDSASKVNSNAQLYKQAGNSIVVNVLCAIFSQLL